MAGSTSGCSDDRKEGIADAGKSMTVVLVVTETLHNILQEAD